MLREANTLKKYLTKQEIFATANKLASAGNIPTLIKVREHLGTGSKGTIHKYFNEWKRECFKNFSNLNKVIAIDNNNLLEEHRILKLDLQKQLTQNEYYAQELLVTEKANIGLKEENRQLQVANQELQLRLSGAEATNRALEQVMQEITHRLDLNDQKTISNLQQTIADLRAELKTLNETSLTTIRETSTKGHEALMQEKVTSINLQAKIDLLNKELLEIHKQLNNAIITSQVQNGSLLRKIEQLEKIIQEHLGLEKLQQVEGSGVRLNSNKVGMAYGK
jgi:hypothetical protein